MAKVYSFYFLLNKNNIDLESNLTSFERDILYIHHLSENIGAPPNSGRHPLCTPYLKKLAPPLFEVGFKIEYYDTYMIFLKFFGSNSVSLISEEYFYTA